MAYIHSDKNQNWLIPLSIKDMIPRGHMWSPGKFYRSVGDVTADTIQNYIKYSNSKWKHLKPGAKKSFPNKDQQRISAYG